MNNTVTVVADFDGTIARIPCGHDMRMSLDYLEESEPIEVTVEYLRHADRVIILTGRTVKDDLIDWLDQHEIRYDEIVTTPRHMWASKNGMRHMREHKVRVVHRIQPDVIIDDDAETLQLVDVPVKRLVVGESDLIRVRF